MTITALSLKYSRHILVWVDFPVPLGAVKRYAFPSTAMAEP
ncbi:MAG: hypothetical protein SOZ77_05875 [Candidatus Limousia pullorum]|nr:hypothetical protein [Candidatus Limousia pullorum]